MSTWQRLFCLLAMLLCPVLSALAQEAPSWEFVGGYSYLRLNGDPDLQSDPDRHINMNGWHSSLTQYANDWFGVTAEVSGHYTKLNDVNVNLSSYFMGVGPQLSYDRRARANPFVHALIGGSVARAKDSILNVKESDSTWAVTLGGGFDMKASPNLAVRVQADYLRSHFVGSVQNHVRVSGGFVYRFGN